MTSLPLNSVIASVHHTPSSSPSSPSTLLVKGYSTPGSTGNVARVEVTIDQGKTWHTASITYQQGKWSWTIWEIELTSGAANGGGAIEIPETGTVYSRAIDEQGNVQPQESLWNVRGVAYNAWGVGQW
jgi:sulfite oxidase